MRHRIGVCALALAITASCGGRQDPPPVLRSLEPTRSFTLPPVKPAEPAFRMTFPGRVPERVVERIGRSKGLGFAVPIPKKQLKVASLARVIKLRVAVIKPLAFRALAPAPTRAADFVWTSLLQGEAIVTPEAAERLDATGANQLVIGNETIPIGAFADMSVPNFADVFVPWFRADALGLKPARMLVVAVRRKMKVDRLREGLERIAPDADLTRMDPSAPAEQPEAIGTAAGSLIGTMTYRIRKNGFIEPDPGWVAANIATARVPLLGTVMCHRLVLPQLGAALAEIERKGLGDQIDPRQYGGCYVPRFIGRDPRRGLSMHAFGLAVDLNVKGNYYGTRGDMDQRIVAIFAKWGFAWGGTWSTPDPMHFELVRLL